MTDPKTIAKAKKIASALNKFYEKKEEIKIKGKNILTAAIKKSDERKINKLKSDINNLK